MDLNLNGNLVWIKGNSYDFEVLRIILRGIFFHNVIAVESANEGLN